MVKVVGIRFSKLGKIYDFDPGEIDFNLGEIGVAKTSEGEEIGQVIYKDKVVQKSKSLKKVLRKATKSDLQKFARLKNEKEKMMKYCQGRINQYGLPMKLLSCEISFDEEHLVFYFTSETRVDFRQLVKDLAHHFKKQIRLQQIGLRDEIKFFESYYGICGQPLCCLKFLRNLEGVTMEMAKIQDIAQKGASKISGVCGKLMCCLSFEADYYKEMVKKLPKLSEKVITPQGVGEVIDLNILVQEVKVRLKDGNTATFKKEDIKKSKGRKK